MNTQAADFLIGLATNPGRLARFSAARRKALAGVGGLSEQDRARLLSDDPEQVHDVVDAGVVKFFAAAIKIKPKKKGAKKKGTKKK